MGTNSEKLVSGYRYGFQGQEKDDEIKGEGNSINYKYRMHDPRIGRFLSIDPLSAKFPQWSSYVFSGNRVIDARELEGLEPVDGNTYFSRLFKGDVIQKVSYFTDIISSTANNVASFISSIAPQTTFNDPKTPQGPYLSVEHKTISGKGLQSNTKIFGVGGKIDIGESVTIESVEFASDGGKSYLNIQINNSNPETAIKINGAVFGVEYKQDKGTGDNKEGGFSVGPFTYKIPLEEGKDPTIEIDLFSNSTANDDGKLKSHFSIAIKNIPIPEGLSVDNMSKAYSQSHDQTQNYIQENFIDKKKE